MSDITPELDNKAEVDRLLSTAFINKTAIGIGKSLQNLTLAVVNARLSASGVLGQVVDAVNSLKKSTEEASTSSERLTRAIKNATVAGAIIAGAGVLVGVATLVFDIYKYTHQGS